MPEKIQPTTGPDIRAFGDRQFEQASKYSPLVLPLHRLLIPNHPDLEQESAVRMGTEIMLDTDSLVLITGRGNPELADDISKLLRMKIDHQPINVFKDGESHHQLGDNMREKDVIIIQTTARSADGKMSVNDAIMDTYLMTRAAKRAYAAKIRLIIPYFGYSRQDKRNMSREPVSASDVVQMLIGAGADSILTMDLHSGATEGSTPAGEPMDILYGSAVLLPEIKRMGLDFNNVVVVSPDAGGTKRAQRYSELLGLGSKIEFLQKDRPADNVAEILGTTGGIGCYKDKDILIVDDMADTCRTFVEGTDYLKKVGRARSVTVVVTHGLFSTDEKGVKASDKITASGVDRVIVTDTVAQSEEIKNNPKIKIVTVAPLLAEAARRLHTGKSLSKLIPMPNGNWVQTC
jgi:ribose-phosphate pyrophosphokinase